ncbi:unnamed protein product [Pelagomonas calceolata]|uniref:Fe2OG dioxygenase domain-containing protein n=1 Tax=Pelagomonas calceolata TaxID=35677 RepID=A0A8J2SCX1_9STRA|nr:unnamed protein product [Pelagomonas calceolata]
MRSFILFHCWASAAALSTSTNALKQAIDLVHRKHDAATARAGQAFQTWSADGAAPATIDVPVDATPYAYPPNCADVPELFAAAPCCAVTAAPLFSADECAFIIDEAERKDGWVPQEFRYARDVVQQCEDLPEVRSWLEAACRDSLFPLLQRTFPEVVGDGAAARDALRVFDSKILRYDSSKGESHLGAHRDGTLLTCVIALNSLDEYEGGGTTMEPLERTIRYDVGRVCVHAGEVRHGGAAVLKGCRYALVVFIDSALAFEPARALANEGDAQRLRGDLDAAAKLYDHAIEAGSRNELPWCGKGQVALEKGQFSEAAACYATAVDITPTHAVAWTNLGVALAKVGAPADVPVLKEAATAFQTAAALDEREPAPLNNLGLLLGDLNIHDAARDAFREAIARADGVPARERADLYTNLGCALVELDAFAEALDAFRSAVEADPTHQNAAKNVLAMRSFLASSAA